MKKGKYEYDDKSMEHFEASAYCDRTGFRVLHKDLRRQYEWAGEHLVYTGKMVHKDFLDEPQPFFKHVPPKKDPLPVKDPRPGSTIPFYKQPLSSRAQETELISTDWGFNVNPGED